MEISLIKLKIHLKSNVVKKILQRNCHFIFENNINNGIIQRFPNISIIGND